MPPGTGCYGAIITEQVFKVNGLGQLLITAIYANDLPMVQTLTFIFAILIVLFNLIADLLYGVLGAGYGWGEEAVVWLFVFGLPAAVALIAARVGR